MNNKNLNKTEDFEDFNDTPLSENIKFRKENKEEILN